MRSCLVEVKIARDEGGDREGSVTAGSRYIYRDIYVLPTPLDIYTKSVKACEWHETQGQVVKKEEEREEKDASSLQLCRLCQQWFSIANSLGCLMS